MALASASASKGDGEEEKLTDPAVAVLDFDLLCATVALQTQGISAGNNKAPAAAAAAAAAEAEEDAVGGGVQRMWEGGVVIDCFADRRIALEAACCPCYRFGKNMRRANLGSCFIQASSYFILSAIVLFNWIFYCITRRHCFLYAGVASVIVVGVYASFFRARIRKMFNIKASDSYLDDCMNHLLCPCCSICQESRTLEINNVQDGVWHGRGDTICVGRFGEGSKVFSSIHTPSSVATRSPERCSMEKMSNASRHSWNTDDNHSEPLVPSA